jgi:L-ascorbate metabolism protein UlaG (beta-lactamase superfamily)
MLDKIHRINHDCFRIDADVIVYTDPFHLQTDQPKADLVLISHDHYDHCSPEDLRKIRKKETIFLATQACREKIDGDVRIVKPGEKLSVKGVDVEVVPAYNTNKDFHPKKSGYVGYVFSILGHRIYFAGDTDYIPEMKKIKCDIALLPVSGTYVMTAEEAVLAAKDISPTFVIPMHYGDIVGTADDAKRFKRLYKGKTEIK